MDLEDNVQQAELKEPCIKEITADSIVFKNVLIYGPDGELVRTYDEVRFDRDVQRDPNGEPLFKSPMRGVAHFEQQGKVLPSLNVTMPCLGIALNNIKDADVKVFLDQYKQINGLSYGWHAQNTVFPWRNGTVDIIHFPFNDDVPKDYRQDGGINIGQNQIVHRGFDTTNFGDMLVSRAIQIPEFARFIRSANGLQDLQRQIELEEYFGKPAKVWVPNNPVQANYTGAAWLGCVSSNFYMNTSSNLVYYIAVRGVRLVSAEGASTQKFSTRNK